VAIICPRKGWFRALRNALRNLGLTAQLQSENEIRGDHPAVAWFTALVVILAEPENAFEIVGVLREVFGHSDHDLAEFSNANANRFTLLAAPNGNGGIADTLRLLVELRAALDGKALLAQVREIVAATRLRDRLLSLPSEEYEAMDEMFDDLLTRAAAAEADGLTLFQLAERLRAEFELIREARPVQPDAIQVITGHKAKGSEWPVVILPFFARSVINTKAQYPAVYRDTNGHTRVAFSKMEMSQESKDWRERRERQEAERLLYVAMTRAKHTLVVVDDRELFATKTGLPKLAQANLFRVSKGGVNAANLVPLSMKPSTCAETMRHATRAS
jgi:ATP-dependent exoDNAse (exonuclease V) beta subunit